MYTAPLALLGALVFAQTTPLAPLDTWTNGLAAPSRMAFRDGETLVVDLVQNAIVRLDASGQVLSTWPEPAGPVGVAVHPDGRIFVSRRDDRRVAVYDATFTFLRFLADGLVTFEKPTDLAMDPEDGRLYVVDSAADRFYAFDESETLALIVGVRGSRSSEFRYPAAIAVDAANDRILVADQDNYRVQIFARSGVFQGAFGYRNIYLPGGGEEGWLPRATGLAVDGNGNIYVADAMMGALRIFSPTGADLGKVVGYGFGPGELRTPGDVAIDSNGRIAVANSGAGSIEFFAPPTALRVEARRRAPRGTNRSAFDDLAALVEVGRANGLSALVIPGWDPPHMLDDGECARCHGIVNTPGGHVGLTEGQANLCFSCHSGGGHAHATLIPQRADYGMSHAWDVPAINATYGSTGPSPSGPMALYLDGGNIKCATCHEQHNNEAGAPFLRAPADDLCQECHADHVIHTPSGNWQPVCTDCHVAHDPDDRNLALVGATIHNQTLGLDKPVVFTTRSGPGSFSDGDPAAHDGVCQVCHTATDYHRHDGSGALHNAGATCTDCHPHASGFLPTGGDCTTCHSNPQDNGDGVPLGGRRAVVGEFPIGDAHAHFGAQLDNDACLVCHSLGTHMDGHVELLDPDDGSIYRFVAAKDLASDPDVSDFCAHCHDADGATRLAAPLDPFAVGNVAPDVATRFQGTLQWNAWYGDFCFGQEGTLRAVNSHHDIADADQAFSGAKLECLDCHAAHGAAASQPTADPFNPTSPWTGDDNGFCLACHAGGNGPLDPGFPNDVFGPALDFAAIAQLGNFGVPDACSNGPCNSLRGLGSCDYQEPMWYVDYAWTHSAHGPDSKRGWPGYSGAPDAIVDCVVCHDPHGSYSPTNTVGNPYMIRDVVNGSTFVDDGFRPGAQWTGPPWDTFGVTREVVVTISGIDVDWGGSTSLCSVCHADWLAAYDWHSFCTACQTCHGHGMAWGETDWANFENDTPCPNARTAGAVVPLPGEPPAIHQRAPQRTFGGPDAPEAVPVPAAPGRSEGGR